MDVALTDAKTFVPALDNLPYFLGASGFFGASGFGTSGLGASGFFGASGASGLCASGLCTLQEVSNGAIAT